jgi:type V secretory pathway adhesin AidA
MEGHVFAPILVVALRLGLDHNVNSLPAHHFVNMVENVSVPTPATAPIHGVALTASNLSAHHLVKMEDNALGQTLVAVLVAGLVPTVKNLCAHNPV